MTKLSDSEVISAFDKEITRLREENEKLRAILAIARIINNRRPDIRMDIALKGWDEKNEST